MKVDQSSVVAGKRQGRHLPCLLLVAVAMLASSGCSLFRGLNDYILYNDSSDEAVLDWRNHVWSSQAWRARQHMFTGQQQFYSFGEGFRDGYKAVAAGGDGCPPAIAPRQYWSYSYQTPEGQTKVAAWFAGYPYGVQAAREDGAGGYRDIQIAGTTGAMYSSSYGNGQCPTCQETHLAPGDGATPEAVEHHPMMQMPNSLIVPQIPPAGMIPAIPNGGAGVGLGGS